MGALLRRWVRYSVMRKGFTGTSPFWTVIGVLGGLNVVRKRLATPQSNPFVSGPIRSGEVIEIRHQGQPDRKLRKERAKRRALVEGFNTPPQGRTGRKVRRRLAGTMVEEFAATAMVTSVPALARLIDPTPAPKRLSRRAQSKLQKRDRKFAKLDRKRAARTARAARRSSRPTTSP
jgi:hypothetical protein